MGCSGCSTSSDSTTGKSTTPKGCNSNGSCGTSSCNKLSVFDWLSNMVLPSGQQQFDCMEVRFKNDRKDFYRNVNNLSLTAGDVIAVESSPGHDIGVVSLTGELVKTQMKRKGVDPANPELKKIYRIAKQQDIDKWKEAQNLERPTMYRTRELALKLGLEMKISDVEYQGDRAKAIFYYTADGRVDFRELIKKMAEEFKIRIEMRQIGARQEASKLGGIGSCGRELCCSTWLTDFRSVSTTAARYQQLSLNPLKLAGQCGKLKCCLNYELDSYLDAIKDFPTTEVKLKTKKGDAFHQKTDIFRRKMWYSYTTEPSVFIEVPVDRVKQVLALNKDNNFPEDLIEYVNKEIKVKEPDFENVVGQDNINRFDKKRKPQHNNQNRNRNRPNNNNNRRRPDNRPKK
ncbi:MAG: hypothetical protein J0M08_09675 [Bacteroidetes bacterium]|nr:hypothetical protein [Bacteroidota bacterium]